MNSLSNSFWLLELKPSVLPLHGEGRWQISRFNFSAWEPKWHNYQIKSDDRVFSWRVHVKLSVSWECSDVDPGKQWAPTGPGYLDFRTFFFSDFILSLPIQKAWVLLVLSPTYLSNSPLSSIPHQLSCWLLKAPCIMIKRTDSVLRLRLCLVIPTEPWPSYLAASTGLSWVLNVTIEIKCLADHKCTMDCSF